MNKNSHNIGEIVNCKVTKIEPSCIYADIGGIEATLSPSQLDKNLQIGQTIQATIVDMRNNKFALSINSMLDNSTGEDFGGVSPSTAESDGEIFGQAK